MVFPEGREITKAGRQTSVSKVNKGKIILSKRRMMR